MRVVGPGGAQYRCGRYRSQVAVLKFFDTEVGLDASHATRSEESASSQRVLSCYAPRSVHPAWSSVHQTWRRVHQASRNVRRAWRNVHQTWRRVHKAGRRVHKAWRRVRHECRSVHQARRSVHQARRSVHQAWRSVHQAWRSVHQAWRSVHQAWRSVHQARRRIPPNMESFLGPQVIWGKLRSSYEKESYDPTAASHSPTWVHPQSHLSKTALAEER
jgi:hypothetical protein